MLFSYLSLSIFASVAFLPLTQCARRPLRSRNSNPDMPAYVDVDESCRAKPDELKSRMLGLNGDPNNREILLWSYIQTATDMAYDVNMRLSKALRRNPVEKTRAAFRQEVPSWSYQAIFGDVGYEALSLFADGDQFKTIMDRMTEIQNLGNYAKSKWKVKIFCAELPRMGINQVGSWLDKEWPGATNANGQPADGVTVYPSTPDGSISTPCNAYDGLDMYTALGQGNLEYEARITICDAFWEGSADTRVDKRSMMEIIRDGLKDNDDGKYLDLIQTPEARLFQEFARIVGGIHHDVRRSESAIAGTPVMMDRCKDFYDCNSRRNDESSRNVDSPKAYELLATMLFLNPAVVIIDGQQHPAPPAGACWVNGAVNPQTLWWLGS